MYKESMLFNGKITDIVEHMMYLSSKDALQMGYGYDAMKQDGITWVLSRLSMNIQEPIMIGENVNIMTQSCGTDRLFYYRRFEITDSGHKVIGKSMSAWIIIDAEKRMPVKNHFRDFSQTECDFIKPARLRIEEENAVKIDSITVKSRHIDINGHVNNIYYMKWIQRHMGDNMPSCLDINYIREAFEGDLLDLYMSNSENSTVYFLKSPKTNKIAVGARLTF